MGVRLHLSALKASKKFHEVKMLGADFAEEFDCIWHLKGGTGIKRQQGPTFVHCMSKYAYYENNTQPYANPV